MTTGLFIGLVVGIFFTALSMFYNWGDIIYFFMAIALACGIGLFVAGKMTK